MATTKSNITQEMIDAVFDDPKLRKKIKNPKKAKKVCEMRLTGAFYTDIGKKHKVSQYYCVQCVRKVDRLYVLFVEVDGKT